MKFTHWTFPALSLAAPWISFGSIAWAADNPFVGDWKLNPSKSKLTDQMKVEALGGNKYAFDFEGDGSAETIVTDGTDQPGYSGTTLSVTAESPDAWKVIRKKDGRMLLTAKWKLSKDGDTLTDNFSEISPNGTPSTVNYVYKRTAGGSGFAGTWVSTSEAVNFVFVIQIRPYDGDGLSIMVKFQQRYVKFHRKGVRTPSHCAANRRTSGPAVPPGLLLNCISTDSGVRTLGSC